VLVTRFTSPVACFSPPACQGAKLGSQVSRPGSGGLSPRGRILRGMTASSHPSRYALGSSDAEHERLIRQAARLAPLTERLFRDAGIGPGQRVLDLGSGVGDVAILTARLVSPAGEVVGIERDTRSIARARARVSEAGLHNVSFTQCDVSQVAGDQSFDAAVGRFILQFVPDPLSVLRSLVRVVRPGGVLTFQEVSYAPFLSLSSHLPLWLASVSLARETFQRSGANTEIGLALHRIFQEAGLPAPSMRLEMLLGSDPDFTRWSYDVLCSLRPQIEQFNLSLETLGDFDTLPERLQTEVAASNTVVPWIALVGAWSRRPTDDPSRHGQRP
jgi:2-polyprenyl-3-methyl-5-hydroxy-6-metoxy-1,4-benzoquinol methylase